MQKGELPLYKGLLLLGIVERHHSIRPSRRNNRLIEGVARLQWPAHKPLEIRLVGPRSIQVVACAAQVCLKTNQDRLLLLRVLHGAHSLPNSHLVPPPRQLVQVRALLKSNRRHRLTIQEVERAQ